MLTRLTKPSFGITIVSIIVVLGLTIVFIRKHGLTDPVPVEVVTVSSNASSSDIVAEGSIVPSNTVRVSVLPGMVGEVTNVFAGIGSFVKKGQLLAEIDPSQAEASYNIAIANADSLKQQYALTVHPYQPEQIDQQHAKVMSDMQSVIEAKNTLAILTIGSRKQLIASDQATVDADKAQSDAATSTLARESTLYTDNLIPKAELESAQTAAEVASDTLKSAQQTLSLAVEGNLPQQLSSGQADVQEAQFTYKADLDELHLMMKGSRPEQIEQAASNLEAAQMAVKQQSIALQHQYIYAPASGVIIMRNVNPGELVESTPSTTSSSNPLAGEVKSMFVIANDTPTVFQADIDQMYSHAVFNGQMATVGIEAYPGKVFDARITSVDPLIYQDQTQSTANIVNPATPLTFTALATIYDPNHRLVPGGQGVLTIHQTVSGLEVPQSAVTPYSSSAGVVYTISGSALKAKRVSFTADMNNYLNITSGLQAGQQVVVSDTAQLKDGMTVKVIPATGG